MDLGRVLQQYDTEVRADPKVPVGFEVSRTGGVIHRRSGDKPADLAKPRFYSCCQRDGLGFAFPLTLSGRDELLLIRGSTIEHHST
jgi:hypothetical protein